MVDGKEAVLSRCFRLVNSFSSPPSQASSSPPASSFASSSLLLLLLILCSSFLCLSSCTSLLSLLAFMGTAAAAVRCLVFTPRLLFLVGLFAMLVLWMYANFRITWMLFVIGGVLFCRTHARPLVLMATMYAVYCVTVQVGWHGIFLSISLAFLSNDLLKYLVQHWDNISDKPPAEESEADEIFKTEDVSSGESVFSGIKDEPEKPQPCKASVSPSCEQSSSPSTVSGRTRELASSTAAVRQEPTSSDEMKRILSSSDHYEALGLPRQNIDAVILKREYRKKAMLVHPDKNMGSPLASESFKKLQCAYEVLSDSTKRRDYDEQLRKEESRRVCEHSYSHQHDLQESRDYCAQESRRIECTICGYSHVWVCTGRIKTTARWCQGCCLHHAAEDGDGWVEYKEGSLAFDQRQRMEIPQAFVCAGSKIFDVSEWAVCQGMAHRPNTHRPSFHVNMVGVVEETRRSNLSRYTQEGGMETMMTEEEEEEEFEKWLRQVTALGVFGEKSSSSRKRWRAFRWGEVKRKKQWWRRRGEDTRVGKSGEETPGERCCGSDCGEAARDESGGALEEARSSGTLVKVDALDNGISKEMVSVFRIRVDVEESLCKSANGNRSS
ncbi:hypothetical protein MLD38_000393 [Melastoma candidum]|uniref:Uncharacterized protein n=1 Tax=Melastoma candidum TaxID=119954 RepID=A0ACB9SBV7_9MYRT|nr:hypothetical protein MLD38_000393 [Melastoma candidum]